MPEADREEALLKIRRRALGNIKSAPPPLLSTFDTFHSELSFRVSALTSTGS